MKRFFIVPVLAASLAGLPVLVGCDRTVSEEKVQKTGPGGTVEKKETTVKEGDGDVKKKTEKTVTDSDGDVKKTQTETNVEKKD